MKFEGAITEQLNNVSQKLLNTLENWDYIYRSKTVSKKG